MRNTRGKVTRRAGRLQIDEEEWKRRARKRRADWCTTAQNRDRPRIQCGAKKNGMWKYDCRCSAEREEMFSRSTRVQPWVTHVWLFVFHAWCIRKVPSIHILCFLLYHCFISSLFFFCFFLSLSFLWSRVRFTFDCLVLRSVRSSDPVFVSVVWCSIFPA